MTKVGLSAQSLAALEKHARVIVESLGPQLAEAPANPPAQPTVVVVGSAGSGKSQMLNALLGVMLLDSQPAHAPVTHGPTIRCADIHLNGVRLIDTPGLDSEWEHEAVCAVRESSLVLLLESPHAEEIVDHFHRIALREHSLHKMRLVITRPETGESPLGSLPLRTRLQTAMAPLPLDNFSPAVVNAMDYLAYTGEIRQRAEGELRSLWLELSRSLDEGQDRHLVERFIRTARDWIRAQLAHPAPYTESRAYDVLLDALARTIGRYRAQSQNGVSLITRGTSAGQKVPGRVLQEWLQHFLVYEQSNRAALWEEIAHWLSVVTDAGQEAPALGTALRDLMSLPIQEPRSKCPGSLEVIGDFYEQLENLVASQRREAQAAWKKRTAWMGRLRRAQFLLGACLTGLAQGYLPAEQNDLVTGKKSWPEEMHPLPVAERVVMASVALDPSLEVLKSLLEKLHEPRRVGAKVSDRSCAYISSALQAAEPKPRLDEVWYSYIQRGGLSLYERPAARDASRQVVLVLENFRTSEVSSSSGPCAGATASRLVQLLDALRISQAADVVVCNLIPPNASVAWFSGRRLPSWAVGRWARGLRRSLKTQRSMLLRTSLQDTGFQADLALRLAQYRPTVIINGLGSSLIKVRTRGHTSGTPLPSRQELVERLFADFVSDRQLIKQTVAWQYRKRDGRWILSPAIRDVEHEAQPEDSPCAGAVVFRVVPM